MSVFGIVITSFIVISLMMLGLGIGLIFGRTAPGKTCNIINSGKESESCCKGKPCLEKENKNYI